MEQKKVVKKKIVKKKVVQKKAFTKKSKSQKFLKKYGLFLLLFFLFSIMYFAWLYGVPAILNSTVTNKNVNDFIERKIGYKVDYSSSNFYTTNTLAVGVKFKDLRLLFPGSKITSDQGLFMKSRLAVFEMPIVPFLMKTIRFNEFTFRTVIINLYQDDNGKYFYIDNIKQHFNPQMPKYIFEIPNIEIYSYSINNFNKKTEKFKKMRGDEMIIKPSQTKEVLREAPKSSSIMLR